MVGGVFLKFLSRSTSKRPGPVAGELLRVALTRLESHRCAGLADVQGTRDLAGYRVSVDPDRLANLGVSVGATMFRGPTGGTTHWTGCIWPNLSWSVC